MPIGWTGDDRRVRRITTDQAGARADSLGGRAPFLWDNYPVNDAVMADRLFLGPLRGPGLRSGRGLLGLRRQPDGAAEVVEAPAGVDRRHTCAATTPKRAWAVDVGDLRPLAEACDGALPQRLVRALVAEADVPAWATPA